MSVIDQELVLLITTGVAVWLPILIAINCESDFYVYAWCGHCAFVYSVSQMHTDGDEEFD